MIEPAANSWNTAQMPADSPRAVKDENFKAALTALQWQSPIAQHLLGVGKESPDDRQKRPEGAVLSVSELSSMPIADLGAPRMNSGANSPSPAAAADSPRQPRGRERPPGESRTNVRTEPARPETGGRNSVEAKSAQHLNVSPNSAAATSSAQTSDQAPEVLTAAPTASPEATRSTVPVMQGPIHPTPGAREQTSGNANQRQDPGAAARILAAAQRTARTDSVSSLKADSAAQRGFAAALEDESKFGAQLSRGLATALRQGGGTVTMRLQPEALGVLTIRMDLQPGRVGATFEVQNEQARQLLNQNMTLLRSALEARGMEVERLDVRVAEPAERGWQMHMRDAGGGSDREHHTGGAGAEDRAEAESRSAGGGAAGNRQADSANQQEPSQDAPASTSAALRLWMQQVDMGGAQVMRLRLDAVA